MPEPDSESETIVLKLYVAGMTPTARRALANLEAVCKDHVDGARYSIEVVDINDQPDRAEDARILATPTAIRELPPPIRKLVGDLSDKEQVLAGLELIPR